MSKNSRKKEVKEFTEALKSARLVLDRLKAVKEDKAYFSLLRSEIDTTLYPGEIKELVGRAHKVLGSSTYSARVLYFSAHSLFEHLPRHQKADVLPSLKGLLKRIESKEEKESRE